MALATLTIACFLFYMTSRHFPIMLDSRLEEHKIKLLLLASAICLFSLYLFIVPSDFATGLVVWLVAFMTLLSSIILSVKLSLRWTWLWAGLCVLFLIIDFS